MTGTDREAAIDGGWTEIRVDVPMGWHELVASELAFGPCTTVALGTTSLAARAPGDGEEAVRTFVASRDDTPALRDQVRTRLGDLARRVGDDELARLEPTFKPLPPEDYATSWRKDWKPYRVGRLVLLPPWDDAAPPRESDLRLTIAPGGSFGSGRHATTRTCLRVLDRRIEGGERVLDAGTGSGILSVAARLLGASSAIGFDIDLESRPSAGELAEANGVADGCDFRTGGFETLDADERDFDVVLANIYADVLQQFASELASRLRHGGWFAFSGCRYDHRDDTVLAIERAGLRIESERRRGRWITFVGSRGGGGA